MISIFDKSEERRKYNEGIIMTIEDEEIKRKKEKKTKRKKNAKSIRVGRI